MPDYIANNMARLMHGPASSIPTKTSDPTFPPVVEKVFAPIERFIGKYGSVFLEIFRLPTFSTAELQRYLNSLSITLKRHGIIAAYSWQYQPAESAYYLFLFHTASIIGSRLRFVIRLKTGTASPASMGGTVPERHIPFFPKQKTFQKFLQRTHNEARHPMSSISSS